jgi:hypothetical protein
MAITCGQVPPPKALLSGIDGVPLPLFITGTDPILGGTGNQIVNMTTEAADFIPVGIATGGTFLILIESAAAIVVQLEDDSDFTISSAHATTYLGDWILMRIKKVYKTGTTGTFSVGF